MKRTVAILVAVLAAFTLTGLYVALTRAGSPPARVRELDWQKIVKSAIAERVAALLEERLA